MCCEATRSLRGEAALRNTGRRASFGKTTSRRLTRHLHDLGRRKNLRLNLRLRCPSQDLRDFASGRFSRPASRWPVGGWLRPPAASAVTAVGCPGHARKALQGRGCESRRASSAVLRFTRAASVLLVNGGTCEGVPRHMSVATVWRPRATLLRPWRSNARLFTSLLETVDLSFSSAGSDTLERFCPGWGRARLSRALGTLPSSGNVQRECRGVEDQASIKQLPTRDADIVPQRVSGGGEGASSQIGSRDGSAGD